MKLLIDGDGCPVVRIAERMALRYQIPLVLFCDTSHVFSELAGEVVTVGKGADAADFALVNRCQRGDLVITQDYGVAAMVLGKGGYALHQSGMEYTAANIDGLLAERHTAKKLRASAKHHWKGPRARTPEDDARFAAALEAILNRIVN